MRYTRPSRFFTRSARNRSVPIPISAASGENTSLLAIGVSSSSSPNTCTLETAGAAQTPSLVVAESPTFTRPGLCMNESKLATTAALTVGGEFEAVTLAVEELSLRFGSGVLALTVAVSLITLVCATLQLTWTTTVNVAVSPFGKLAMVQVMAPVLPTAGSKQVQALAPEFETKVVPAGRLSVSVTLAALFGPLLATVIVYVMLVPVSTVPGEAVFVTARSA